MKAKNTMVWIMTLLFVAVEQGIKLIINQSYLQANTPIIAPWLYFKPLFNRDYSWINSLFQLGIGKWLHVFMVVVVVVMIYIAYRYLQRKSIQSALIDITFTLLFAGAICSFLDKVFWNGSLDYILLNGFFTFDLKDAFINVALGLIAIMAITDHRGLRTSS